MGLGQYDLLKSVQPTLTTNLNVLNVVKLNTILTDTTLEGDLISYKKVTTVPAEKLSIFYESIKALCYVPETDITFTDLDMYELVYWGNDSRGNTLTQMSATLAVPKNLNKNFICSHKHGTYGNLIQTYTERAIWKKYVDDEISLTDFLINYGTAVGLQCTVAGCLMVMADSPSYGVSNGIYNYADQPGEVYSQTNAVVATRRLIELNPNGIFDNFVLPSNGIVDVVLTGYSLGGISITTQAGYINKYSDTFKLKSKICLSGGVSNTSALLYNFSQNLNPNDNSVPYANTYGGLDFIGLILIISSWTGGTLGFELRHKYLRENIITDVIPLLYNLYFDREFTSGFNTLLDLFVPYVKSCLNNLLYEQGHEGDPAYVIPPWLPFDPVPLNPVNYTYNIIYTLKSGVDIMNIVQLFGNVSFICSGENINTNKYITDVPIVNIYSSGDELMHCKHLDPTDPTAPLVQGPDNVVEYFKSLVTGSVIPDNAFYQYTISGNKLNPPSHRQWPDKKHPNSLNRTNPEQWESYELEDSNDYQIIVQKALSTIGTNNCKNLVVNTTGKPSSGHAQFVPYTFTTYIYSILKNIN